ncbi:S8 family serine peptidase [Gracilibacillus sp. S3-1-1]|uniref:S8 family serine peptidase n=1 Tax=Gracilibacillus pellucidus TaxID=3095368 RepID=A0ACC6M411_9BACI|nr:S8 family serine peptidase [Gracilibacillus sp. S3-1-1]MDX8045705.1 S8 family serine peptidase [Gracilibacillus sp. S3-1-1]
MKDDSIDLATLEHKQIIPWGQKFVGVSDENYSKRNVKIAILDSGINMDHKDLNGKIKKRFNAINTDENIIDDFNHGTAIAGIITANDNDFGIIGIVQNVEIYDVKVLGENGTGDVKSLIRGINWAIDQDVDIIHISSGVETNSVDLEETINTAVDRDIIIVAAAGNTFGLFVNYPAKYSNVLSISAIDENLVYLSTSGKGKIDFSAPGKNIISTNNKGTYEHYSGTSFATAYATGVIATQLNKKDINSPNREILKDLDDNTFKYDTDKPTEMYGKGILIN